MNPLDSLKPNYMADILVNYGVDQLTQNKGLGVKETNPQAAIQRQESNNPIMDKIRTAKAREFGKPKESVGF